MCIFIPYLFLGMPCLFLSLFVKNQVICLNLICEIFPDLTFRSNPSFSHFSIALYLFVIFITYYLYSNYLSFYLHSLILRFFEDSFIYFFLAQSYKTLYLAYLGIQIYVEFKCCYDFYMFKE